jgi:hypothetical protein
MSTIVCVGVCLCVCMCVPKSVRYHMRVRFWVCVFFKEECLSMSTCESVKMFV